MGQGTKTFLTLHGHSDSKNLRKMCKAKRKTTAKRALRPVWCFFYKNTDFSTLRAQIRYIELNREKTCNHNIAGRPKVRKSIKGLCSGSHVHKRITDVKDNPFNSNPSSSPHSPILSSIQCAKYGGSRGGSTPPITHEPPWKPQKQDLKRVYIFFKIN